MEAAPAEVAANTASAEDATHYHVTGGSELTSAAPRPSDSRFIPEAAQGGGLAVTPVESSGPPHQRESVHQSGDNADNSRAADTTVQAAPGPSNADKAEMATCGTAAATSLDQSRTGALPPHVTDLGPPCPPCPPDSAVAAAVAGAVQAAASGAVMRPLLKASPPMPVGRMAGRFKVRLRRACLSQPFGLVFRRSKPRGSIVVAEEMPHLGLRRGDEVLYINNYAPVSVRNCMEMLEKLVDVEIQVIHRECVQQAQVGDCLSFNTCQETPEPSFFDMCFNPPLPRCSADSWPLRNVLLTSGPMQVAKDPKRGPGNHFSLIVSRTSLKQPFGMNLCVDCLSARSGDAMRTISGGSSLKMMAAGAPSTTTATRTTSVGSNDDTCSIDHDSDHDLSVRGTEEFVNRPDAEEIVLNTGRGEASAASSAGVSPAAGGQAGSTMLVKESLPHYGLKEGDQLLQINGVQATSMDRCQALLKAATTVVMEFRRLDQTSRVQTGDDLPVAKFEDKEFPPPGSWTSGFLGCFGPGLFVSSCCVATGDAGVLDAEGTYDFEVGSSPPVPASDDAVA